MVEAPRQMRLAVAMCLADGSAWSFLSRQLSLSSEADHRVKEVGVLACRPLFSEWPTGQSKPVDVRGMTDAVGTLPACQLPGHSGPLQSCWRASWVLMRPPSGLTIPRERKREPLSLWGPWDRLYGAVSSELPESVNSLTTSEASSWALPLMVTTDCTLAS